VRTGSRWRTPRMSSREPLCERDLADERRVFHPESPCANGISLTNAVHVIPRALVRKGSRWRTPRMSSREPLCELICHLSFVICHLSLVTCHLSPVTCHLSLVTYHLSLVTYHLSLVTCHLSLVTKAAIFLKSSSGMKGLEIYSSTPDSKHLLISSGVAFAVMAIIRVDLRSLLRARILFVAS